MCVVTLCFGYIWGSNHYHNMHGIGLAYSICWNTIPPKKKYSKFGCHVRYRKYPALYIYVYKLCIYIYTLYYIYIYYFFLKISFPGLHVTKRCWDIRLTSSGINGFHVGWSGSGWIPCVDGYLNPFFNMTFWLVVSNMNCIVHFINCDVLGCHPSHWRTPSFFKMIKS